MQFGTRITYNKGQILREYIKLEKSDVPSTLRREKFEKGVLTLPGKVENLGYYRNFVFEGNHIIIVIGSLMKSFVFKMFPSTL